MTTVGPHRDELVLQVGGLAGGPTARRASSGRWRWPCASPATNWSPSEIGSAPILLLDDVFSELDPARSEALLGCLPAGQAVVTTADAANCRPGPNVATQVRVEDGKLLS